MPCFTLRDNTERPVTITQGTNTLVGADGAGLAEAFSSSRERARRRRLPSCGTAGAGERIAGVLSGFVKT